MSKVAIIGSCITRDLWPIRGDTAELLYLSRTSLPSLFSSPVKGFRPRRDAPAELGGYQHRALVTDLQKTALAALVAFQPTHLIFDFIDERFDLLSVGSSLITRSWELQVSGYLDQPAFRSARPVPRLSAGCGRLWREGAAQMAALIRATPLSRARLILHSARWSEAYRDAKGRLHPLPTPEILPGEPAETAAFNRLLAAYEAEFAALMPPLDVVSAPQHWISDEAHAWGLSPFHYVPAYYADIWTQLQALGVERLRGPGDGPSARAA